MKIWTVFFALLLCATFAFAQGTVVDTTLYSTALHGLRSVEIYLPEGYSSSTTHYPVIYFLHGLGEDAQGYAPMLPLLDTLIANQAMQPVIMVKPDGSQGPYGGSMYSNSALYGQFENYIFEDVIAFADSNYRTIPNRHGRVIMGHSMGGYGCLKIGLKHPELFCAIGAMSGFVSLDPFENWRQGVLAENNGHGPFNPLAGFFSYASYTAAGAFTPNMNRPPYYVDLPIDSAGNMIDSIFTRWRLEMPDHFAHLHAPDSLPALYFDCGMQDELYFYPMNQHFAATLDSLEIPYRFEGYTGGHEDHIYERGPVVFAFLDSVLRVNLATPEHLLSPYPLALSLSSFPNPFNSTTNIEFVLPQAQKVSLKVYDVLGQEVADLAEGTMTAGSHRIFFDASALSSGIYFYRLATGKELVQTKKMVLLR